MARAPLTLAEEPFDGPGAQELDPRYVAEVREMYPEFGAGVPPAMTAGDVEPPHGRWLFAYREGRPVGCAAIKRLDERAAELKRVYVVPEERATGVARALLCRIELIAREAGYRAIRLDTGARQLGAQTLFRSSGYHEIADYNGNPAASYWFEKRI